MTIAETKDLIVFARSQRIRELSVGDVHVLFDPELVTEAVAPSRAALPKSEAEATGVSEDEAEKLMDDPDLFQHVAGDVDRVEAEQ